MALKFLNDGYFAGKVGIGTVSPVSILDIFSTAPTLTIGGIAVNQTESGRIRFTEDASTADFQGSYIHYDGSTNKMHIGVHEIADDSVSNDVNAITIRRINGYVGIGNVSPGYRLSVNGTIQSDLIRGYTYPDHSFLDFDYDQTAVTNSTALTSIARVIYISDSNGNDPATSIGHSFMTGTTDSDTATPLLTILNNGNVGIGTTSPSRKLVVSGAANGIIQSNDTAGAGSFLRILADVTAENLINWDKDTDLRFCTSDEGFGNFSERMRIDSSGNVGIGRSSSITARLFVQGPVDTATISTSSTPAARINNGGAISNWIGSNGYNYGYIQSIQDDGSNNLKPLSLQPLGGNVGIGTTNPPVKLVVSNGGASGLEFNPIGGVGNNAYIQSYNRSTNSYENLTYYANNHYFNYGSSTRMIIQAGGNVGIGTTSPGAKLVVASTTNDNTTVNTVKISHARSNTDVGTNAVYVDMNLSGADATTADRQNRGVYVDIDSTANGDASNEHRIRGFNSDVRFSGFSDIVQSGYFYAESNNSTVKTAQLIGAYGHSVHDSSTTTGGVSNMYGVYGLSDIQDLGDVDNAFGGFFQVNIGGARGNANIGITKGVEGQINIDKSTTIDYGTMSAVSAVIDNNEGAVPNFGNQFLFRGDYQGDRGSDAYGIYCEGDKHYLEGKLAINLATPTQVLHVAGNARVTGAYYDSNNSPGTANQVLVSTVTGTDWVDGSGSSIIGGPYLPLAGGTMTGGLTMDDSDILFEHSDGNNYYRLGIGASANFEIYNTNYGRTDLLITQSNGNATFAGDITLGANHIGRDDDNYIGFESDDLIKFRVAGATQVKISDGVFTAQTDSDVDLGSSGVRFKELWVDSINGGSVVPGSYLPLAGNTTATAMTGDIFLANQQQVRFLTSANAIGLRMQSSGTSSFIDNEVGIMYIRQEADNNDMIFQADDGLGGNATYFFLDGSEADGNGNLYTNFPDKSRLTFGDNPNGDLQIYHNGNDSYIEDAGTGDLRIVASATKIYDADMSHFQASFTDGGSVDLYYGGNKKFETTSTGVTVTGAATATTFLGDLNGTINTATTAVTQLNAVDNETVATTAYVNNKIGLIPAGLVFQGTWNAATNTPTLTSGSGTTGNFYIVSVAGSTNLDGITDWKVGDWAVFIEQGLNDQWEKIDNSSVLDGFGTGQSVTKWDGSGTSNTLTSGPITFSTSNNNSTFAGSIYANTIYSSTNSSYYIDVVATGLGLNMAGSATFAGDVNLAAGKKLQYSANSFITPENNTSGAEISTAGTFIVKTGSTPTLGLTLDASQNATFAGDITSKGLTVDYTGNRTGDAGILVTNDNDDWGIKVDKDGTADYGILSQTDGENAIVVRNAAGTTNIQLQGDGDASFAGDVVASGALSAKTTSVTAALNVLASNSTNVKATKIGNDTTSIYFYNTQADAVLAWTCGSYHHAEVVITASQTNGGTYNNLYIRGIWSNNHTSHHWDELEHVGGLTGSTITMSVGQNGATTNSGRLELDFNYISASFATLNVRVTDFYGTHSYTIT